MIRTGTNSQYRESENGGLDGYNSFIKAAERHGLDVLVGVQYVDIVRYAFANNIENQLASIQSTSSDDRFTYRYELVIYNRAMSVINSSSSCVGFILGDEWKASEAKLYNSMVKAIRVAEADAKALGLIEKDLIITTSQLPTYAYELDGGPAMLTTDITKQNDKATAYEDYISNFGASGEFTYDSYSLWNKLIGGYSVDEDWFDNLKYVAEAGISRTGVTIQSCAISGGTTASRYAPTQKSDIGFQVYTALAYGMKQINYFCYNKSSDSNVTDWISNNEAMYNAVQSVNAELSKLEHVLMHYSWKGALDLAAGTNGTGTSANSERLTSATVSDARAIVGCMKDVFGNDGYMVANAAGPRTTTPSSVTLTFDNAYSVVVYEGGIPKTKPLTDGAITLTVGVGEGVFVIPQKAN